MRELKNADPDALVVVVGRRKMDRGVELSAVEVVDGLVQLRTGKYFNASPCLPDQREGAA